MKKTKLSTAAFGTILGIAGIEHGVGEILQGNKIAGNLFIKSWPDNRLYDILAGEPAFTILTELPIYITGIIAIIVSSLIIVWAVFFLERKYGKFIFTGLILSQFLFGGGMAGPVLMGILLSWVSFKIDSKKQLFKNNKQIWKILKAMWKYVFPISIVCWFSLWPGLVLIGAADFYPTASTVYILSALSLITFVLSIISALACDNLKK